jgi:hypothetical protein
MYVQFSDRLEEVADWLTKLLLGAGLTQLHSLWARGASINSFFADATADRPLGTIIAVPRSRADFFSATLQPSSSGRRPFKLG